MNILAIDLGKFKSVAWDYNAQNAEPRFTTLPTTPGAMHDLLAEREPDRVVIEIGSAAGWIQDLCEALEIQVQVANPHHEAWRWKNVKRKTDKDDALKLARLSAMDPLPTIKLPTAKVRQWRSLIAYRWARVGRRTAIRNSIRAILDRQGLSMPAGRRGWTDKARAALQRDARPLDDLCGEELWRG